MDILNEFLVQPNAKLLQLLSYLIYTMMLFHLPYMGMVLVSSGLSTAFRRWKPDMSKDLGNLVLGNPWVWIGFGILPGLMPALLFKMFLFNTGIPIHAFQLRILGLLVLGFPLLWLYRKTGRFIYGAAGTLLILAYCFHFINLSALLVYPEKWPFLKALLPYPLFSITPLLHFGAFIHLSLLTTGAAILFIYYRWPERKLPEQTPHYFLLKYHGLGLLLAGALPLPIILFIDLGTLPNFALSLPVFVTTGLIVLVTVLLLGAAAILIKHRRGQAPFTIAASLLLALLLFGLVIGKDHALHANASLETNALLHYEAQKVRREIVNQRQEIYAKNMVIDPAVGEQIFTERCTACHSFEKQILGPPFNTVLPKYFGKADTLEAFLKRPSKVDPNYPSMPNPGLTTIQVKSTVKYLMKRMGQDTEEKKEDVKDNKE